MEWGFARRFLTLSMTLAACVWFRVARECHGLYV
jgi:hypothetical protein